MASDITVPDSIMVDYLREQVAAANDRALRAEAKCLYLENVIGGLQAAIIESTHDHGHVHDDEDHDHDEAVDEE